LHQIDGMLIKKASTLYYYERTDVPDVLLVPLVQTVLS